MTDLRRSHGSANGCPGCRLTGCGHNHLGYEGWTSARGSQSPMPGNCTSSYSGSGSPPSAPLPRHRLPCRSSALFPDLHNSSLQLQDPQPLQCRCVAPRRIRSGCLDLMMRELHHYLPGPRSLTPEIIFSVAPSATSESWPNRWLSCQCTN